MTMEQHFRELNEALLVSSVRQHELAEQMEKANAAMRESEERYRTLFDLSPVAVYSIDASGVIQKFNGKAAELWGREPAFGDTDERFCGSFKLFRPDGSFMPHEQSPMAEVLSGKISGARDAEVLIERPDGSRITVVVNIGPLKNHREEITGAINCFYDITERKRLSNELRQRNAELSESDRRKDEFLAMLGHELRNPLAPILNAVQLLGLQRDESGLQKRARAIIERQLGQLVHLVDDLLEVSRISTGRVHLQREQLDMRAIVECGVETVRPLIEQRRHALDVRLPPSPIWIDGDSTRLEQVVVNLLNNAAKYTDEGGHIWLSLQQEGNEAVLQVRDSGVGIAPELLPRVFDLFTQAERSLDRSQGGLGLGLCLVQRLVEMHRGKVHACSVLGRGSEFVVRLPVVLTPLPSPLLAMEPAAPTSPALRVLVVEDSRDASDLLSMLLKASGHQVRIAVDGPTALESVLDFQPNVVILDIGLPGMNGLDVARRIRQQPALKDVVLIAMTGYGKEADRQRSLEAGFDHHLIKPADFRKVTEILSTVQVT